MATRADFEQRCRASERGRLETKTFSHVLRVLIRNDTDI